MKENKNVKQIKEFVKRHEEYFDFPYLEAFLNGKDGLVTVFVYSDLKLVFTSFKETTIDPKMFIRIDTITDNENQSGVTINGYYQIFDFENCECLCYIEKPILLKDELKI